MSFPDGPEQRPDSDEHLGELEREAEAARRKLAETEARADQKLERAEQELAERGAELEGDAERIRRELRAAGAPPPPRDPKSPEEGSG